MYSVECEWWYATKNQFIYVLVQEKDLHDFLFLTFIFFLGKNKLSHTTHKIGYTYNKLIDESQ